MRATEQACMAVAGTPELGTVPLYVRSPHTVREGW